MFYAPTATIVSFVDVIDNLYFEIVVKLTMQKVTKLAKKDFLHLETLQYFQMRLYLLYLIKGQVFGQVKWRPCVINCREHVTCNCFVVGFASDLLRDFYTKSSVS